MPRTPDSQTVIDMVRSERLRRKISQRALAQQLGISQSYLATIEQHSDRDITLGTLIKVAKALGGVVTVKFGVTDVQAAAQASTDAYTAPETPETPSTEEP